MNGEKALRTQHTGAWFCIGVGDWFEKERENCDWRRGERGEIDGGASRNRPGPAGEAQRTGGTERLAFFCFGASLWLLNWRTPNRYHGQCDVPVVGVQVQLRDIQLQHPQSLAELWCQHPKG